jgi:hypothetical protein
VANLDIGLEVFYTKVETAFAGNFATVNNGVAGLAAGTYEAKNQDFWTGAFRVQRNFWP